MNVPDQWREYDCEDYFISALATDGYWDDPSQLWLIERADSVDEDAENDSLQLGRPGVDDIGFGYRKGQQGFWAFHRMVTKEFQFLAPTVMQFLEGWLSGKITV